MINTEEMLDALRIAQTSVASPKTIYQPELLSICLALKAEEKQFIVVSTDRYRLTKTVLFAHYSDVASIINEAPKNFLIYNFSY
jgi:hypothetical protein